MREEFERNTRGKIVLKHLKKRFLILAIVICVVLAITTFFILSNADHYTLKYNYFSSGMEINPENIHVSFSRDGILKLDKAYLDNNNTICLDLSSVAPGTVTVYCDIEIEITSTGERFSHKMVDYTLTVSPHLYIREDGRRNFNAFYIVEIVILVCLAAIAAVMFISFWECYKNAYFSYSMVAYGGLFLYIAAIVVYTTYYMIGYASTDFNFFINSIYKTGFYFPYIAFIPVMAISFLIAFSNFWLLEHEGYRPVNALGIIFGIILFLGNCFVIYLGQNSISVEPEYQIIITAASMSASYLISFFEILFLFIMLTAILSTRFKVPFNKDYIIILGCGIRADGSLTPLLKGRVDAALAFEKEQFEATGKHAKFVPSGGQGPDEVISESEAMKNYLVTQNIPEDMIVMENKSTNTWENIKFSKEVIEKDAGSLENIKAAFATTNYHVFRGYTLSEEHGLDAQGLSAKTKFYFYPNAFLREFAGLIVAKKLFIGITSAVIVGASAVLCMLW